MFTKILDEVTFNQSSGIFKVIFRMKRKITKITKFSRVFQNPELFVKSKKWQKMAEKEPTTVKVTFHASANISYLKETITFPKRYIIHKLISTCK